MVHCTAGAQSCTATSRALAPSTRTTACVSTLPMASAPAACASASGECGACWVLGACEIPYCFGLLPQHGSLARRSAATARRSAACPLGCAPPEPSPINLLAGPSAAASLCASWAGNLQSPTSGALPSFLPSLCVSYDGAYAGPYPTAVLRVRLARHSPLPNVPACRRPPIHAAPASSSCMPTPWHTGCCQRWRESWHCRRRR